MKIPSPKSAATATTTTTTTTGENVFCFLIDNTASMKEWIAAIVQILPSLIRSMALTNIFDKMCILSYTDYDQPVSEICKFSGFCSTSNVAEIEKLQTFAKSLKHIGGGGIPEAVKTALVELTKHKTDNLYILHLTDAPPHSFCDQIDKEGLKEQNLLGNTFDWLQNVAILKSSFNHVNYSCLTTSPHILYCHLARVTGGNVFQLEGKISAVNIRNHISRFFNGLFGLGNPINVQHFISNWSNVKRESEMKKMNVIKKTIDPAPNNNLSNSLLECIDKLKSDAEFLNHVFEEFRVIVSTSPMSLTISPIIGRMWREMCKKRSDPRRNDLITLLMTKKNSLNKDEQVILNDWLKESFNATTEIEAELKEFISTNETNGLVRFVPEKNFCAQQIVNLLAAGDKKSVAEIRSVLIRFNVDEKYKLPITNLNDYSTLPLPSRTIPLNLPDKKLWELVLHIVAPGTKLSLRYAAILACHAIQCGSVLAPKAIEFLNNIKGEWINWSRNGDNITPQVPETFAYSFINLILHETCVFCLTSEELKYAKFMQRISHALRFFRPIEVNVQIADLKSIDGSFPDNEYLCSECNVMRPLTLITKDGICGDCYYFKNVSKEHPKFENGMVRKNVKYVQVRCCSCESIYSRDKDANIKGNSKCFSCKNEDRPQPAPFSTCKQCHNNFVQYYDPNNTGLPKGLCGACAAGLPPRVLQYKKFPVNANQILSDYFPQLCKCIGLIVDKTFKSNMSLYEAILHFKEQTNNDDNDDDDNTLPNILFREAKIHNLQAIWDYVQQIMTNTVIAVTLPECSVCLEQFSFTEIMPSCGRRGCQQRVCENCNKMWYKKNVPGKLLYQRATTCQFCSRIPAPNILEKFDRRLINLALSIKQQNLDPDTYYAWCSSCFKPHEIGHHNCAQDAPVINNYTCPTCNNFGTPDIVSKQCPQCTIMTEKSSGCNHMTCRCGAHWCFECGIKCETSHNTYEHMWSVHGRIFDHQTPNNNDDNDEYY